MILWFSKETKDDLLSSIIRISVDVNLCKY